MKISLKNKILNINLIFYKEPKLKKLEKELSDFFEKNKIEGKKIKKFEIKKEVLNYKIIPTEPHFEGTLSGGKYKKQLKKIGEKYGIKDLGLIHWCYGK